MNINRQKLINDITAGEYTTGNIFKDMELQQFIKDQPPAECVPLSEVYRVIAGHSNYHGDNILAALTCMAVGKEVKPVRPLPADVPDTNVGEWIPCSDSPKESGYYMACIYESEVDNYDFRKTWFAHVDDYDIEESEWRELYDSETVTAWMPLPKPYKGE